MKLVFLGPPGAGKGTQAEFLKEEYGFQHISTGEVLRQEIKKESKLGSQVKQYVNKGELVPDNIITKIVVKKLKHNENNSLVLDGFPRNLNQAEILEENAVNFDKVVYFNAAEEILIERLSNRLYCPDCKKFYNLKSNPPKNDKICDKCGSKLVQREDDRPRAIKKRLEVYNKNTHPLVKHYEKLGKLIRIDASQTIDDVKLQVKERLDLG